MDTDTQHNYNLTIVLHGDYLRSYVVSEFICVDRIVMNAKQSYNYWMERLQGLATPLDPNLERVYEFGRRLLSIKGVSEVVLHASTISIEIDNRASWSSVNSSVIHEINCTFQWSVGVIRQQKFKSLKLEEALSP